MNKSPSWHHRNNMLGVKDNNPPECDQRMPSRLRHGYMMCMLNNVKPCIIEHTEGECEYYTDFCKEMVNG